MALSQSELFEDKYPLFRSCPTLNEIRIAEDIKDVTIENNTDSSRSFFVGVTQEPKPGRKFGPKMADSASEVTLASFLPDPAP
ncbi:unnamed protein product [Dibothriocephalus latus]|uniref:Uncharacterized protein n=1 Tax=Dibothriocephalus latus TaxID=60516 RepID=A0A3P7P1R3_DIBLA|nr:unnamed protein product [Dibothriocephalus latus]